MSGRPETENERRATSDLVPAPPEDRAAIEQHDLDEEQARRAGADVRRRERSAD